MLDLGCGSGWATRLMARMVADGQEGFGQVVGIDISDEMIRQARAASKEFGQRDVRVGIGRADSVGRELL